MSLLDQDHHHEDHINASEYLKSFTYGGLDGILSSLGVVMAGYAIGMEPSRVFVFGLTAALANAFGMGLGDYASSVSQNDYNKLEEQREKWEMQENLECEKKELVEIYTKKGISLEDATAVVDRLARHPKCFLNIMMLEELHFKVDEDSSPAVNGLITFVSFLVLGVLPILPYMFARGSGDDSRPALYFWVSSAMGAALLYMMGALKSMFGITKWTQSANETLLIGAAATFLGFLFGLAFDLTGA